jgi:YD repeat-containing protein
LRHFPHVVTSKGKSWRGISFDEWAYSRSFTSRAIFFNGEQVASVTTPDPDGASALTASVTSYTYDYLNRLASTVDALSGTTSFTYDLNNRLINLRDPVNNEPPGRTTTLPASRWRPRAGELATKDLG